MKKQNITKWEIFSRIIITIQFLFLIGGGIFTLYQLKEIKNNQLNRKNDLLIRYYDVLSGSINKRISITIDKKHNLFIKNDGVFTENQIDDYLGVFNDLAMNLNSELLDPDMVCSGFYDITIKTWENKEIQNYLSLIRKSNPDYFTGFDSLASFMKSCK